MVADRAFGGGGHVADIYSAMLALVCPLATRRMIRRRIGHHRSGWSSSGGPLGSLEADEEEPAQFFGIVLLAIGNGSENRTMEVDMTSDKPGEAVSASDEGSASERPGCVTAYAVLLLIGGGLDLLLPFVYAFGLAGSMLTTQDMVVESIRSTGRAVVSILTAIGLWRLKRWAVWLVCSLALYGLGTGLYSVITAAATYGGSVLLYAGLPTLLSLVLIYWFLKNRALFKPSPLADRWIGIGGALVLGAIFVMELVWV